MSPSQNAQGFTLKNLDAVDDMAPKFGISGGSARFPREDLELSATGCAYYRLDADARQPFGHKHDEAEEVYLVLGGSGRVKIEDAIVELQPLDTLRVAPKMTRQFEAGPDGMEYFAFGPRHEGDGEIIMGWWAD